MGLQVIYLDTDTHPLQNPTLWLDWELFKAKGALFWPDFHDAGVEEVIFNQLS